MKRDLGEVYHSMLCAIQALRGVESQYSEKHGDCDELSSAIHCIADALDSHITVFEDLMNEENRRGKNGPYIIKN